MDLFELCVCVSDSVRIVNCLVKQFAISLGMVVECYESVECGWRGSV